MFKPDGAPLSINEKEKLDKVIENLKDTLYAFLSTGNSANKAYEHISDLSIPLDQMTEQILIALIGDPDPTCPYKKLGLVPGRDYPANEADKVKEKNDLCIQYCIWPNVQLDVQPDI